MKTILVLFGLIFSLTSCSDDENKVQENSIIGTWKLVEVYGSDGANGQWNPIENGYTYNFTEPNVLISNRFPCNGIFSTQSDSLAISFDCGDNQFNMIYGISFDGQNLILSPDPINCDEGCAEKYEKLAE